MSAQSGVQILKGAHVMDPGQGIDRVVDVTIADGKIQAIGASPAVGEMIDFSGCYLSPGWIDIHVHVYGTLGFADPDSIGVYQGVTTYVDAGGAGIDTIDEFAAMMDGRTLTRLYLGAYMRPMGLISLNFIEGDTRTLTSIPIAKWLDYMKQDRDRIRYLKVAALTGYGHGPMKMFKGLAETLRLPLYAHVGEFQLQPGADVAYEIYGVVDAGDIITHLYHGNECGLLDKDGKIMPVIKDAARRGVLFDVGFGGYNFSWSVAEKAVAQDFLPDLISSDLQQFNVVGPAYSLANVMTVCMRLGMSVRDVIERVTVNAARALSLADRGGSLRPGMPADITVFRIEDGDFALSDTQSAIRRTDRRITPLVTFKDGRRIECDVMRCQDERNWLLQIAEDKPPDAVERFSPQQRRFLAALAQELSQVQWDDASVEHLDLDKAIELHLAFRRVRAAVGIPLKPALTAVFDSFLNHPFTMQVGLFLLRRPRDFALARLKEAAERQLQLT